jgi:hypothetical protein
MSREYDDLLANSPPASPDIPDTRIARRTQRIARQHPCI